MAAAAGSAVLFTNAHIVDGTTEDVREGYSVLVEDDRVREVSDRPITTKSARIIDLNGRILMPGLIDCHVHVVAGLPSLGGSAALPDSLVAARAALTMKGMLMRGFTTVRDVGGADHGLVMAVEEGAIVGPRLVISGKALSQTGGHADFRGRFDDRPATHYASRLGAVGRVVDGVPEIRRAAREEIKAGASFIKIMANGGIASPTDPVKFLGFSREEVAVVVEEARMAQTYVAGHLYTDEAIRRFIECGGHSVEHGNLATSATARLIREQGAVVVPTLVTFEALAEEGAALGFPPESLADACAQAVRGDPECDGQRCSAGRSSAPRPGRGDRAGRPGRPDRCRRQSAAGHPRPHRPGRTTSGHHEARSAVQERARAMTPVARPQILN
jgi:imidazolonepropionase-like amidohydrolase